VIEFSLPKYWYGHNVHLLYNFMRALEAIKEGLEALFQLKTRAKLPEPHQWNLYRLDVCYAWRFPNEHTAGQYLDSLKHLTYPGRKPDIFPTGILFKGTTYSLKFYLKHPEFKLHDRKELLKSKAAIEWIDHLEAISEGVLRVEATLRRKYLKAKGLLTVASLLEPIHEFHWDAEVSKAEGFDPRTAMLLILEHWEQVNGIDLQASFANDVPIPFADRTYFYCPPTTFEAEGNLPAYHHPGGGFTYKVKTKSVDLINFFINKFLGSETRMQNANQVQARLLEAYKPVKAARLVSVWLYVQRFGSDQARDFFGKNSFNRSKRDLKSAGISLLEEKGLVQTVDSDFLRNFSLDVPSAYATNKEDDFRDSGNILNFVPKLSGTY
jgi:hypothetical protein